MPDIILASSSPYRRDLLARLGIPFHTLAPNVDEDAWKSQYLAPVELAEQLALAKATTVARQYPEAIVIGSDQLVSFAGDVLGKPGTQQAAAEQLQRLSGGIHELITSLCVIYRDNTQRVTNTTRLTMRPLTPQEIDRYIERDQPLDCAGSYKIEAAGIGLFERIETDDFTAITGLPMLQLSTMLREFGVALWTQSKSTNN